MLKFNKYYGFTRNNSPNTPFIPLWTKLVKEE
jgi:hypothetical protein